MAEKCLRNLPSLRVSDGLEMALMRLSARDDRTLSDYIKKVLERHAFGHAGMLADEDELVSGFGAQHGAALRARGEA
jgi:hypothetical protein